MRNFKTRLRVEKTDGSGIVLIFLLRATVRFVFLTP